MQAQALADLPFDGVKRVKRRHRFLKHHADLIAAKRHHRGLVMRVEAITLPGDVAGLHGAVGKKPESGKRGNGFA